MTQLPRSVEELSGKSVELFGRSEILFFRLDYLLPFLEHMHEFNAGYRALRRLEGLEPQHRPGHPLYSSMVLLHD